MSALQLLFVSVNQKYDQLSIESLEGVIIEENISAHSASEDVEIKRKHKSSRNFSSTINK
jgi:hypothetical protein